ncbi:MAG: hypothetical protein RLZZ490_2514 [Cyanobacteriota bacterium]|jgi:hypothetical protein
MRFNISIPKQLDTLSTLYQQGYKSNLIEQSLSKIIDLERHHAHEHEIHLKNKLLTYEKQYQMNSEHF